MFERFTDRSRRVVVLAQEESRLLGHNYIGTEHLLLGLIHEDEGPAAVVLKRLGVSVDKVRTVVEERIGRNAMSTHGHIPFTPRCKKVFDLSLRESLQLGHNYIGTEHILLGLIREGAGVAAAVLVQDFGISLQQVRHEVITVLTGYEESVEEPEPPPRASIGLTDDVILGFVAWADEFNRVNGPLAAKHPLVLVRKALKARTRPA